MRCVCGNDFNYVVPIPHTLPSGKVLLFLLFEVTHLCWPDIQCGTCGTDFSMCQYSIFMCLLFHLCGFFLIVVTGQSLSLVPCGPVPVVLHSCIKIRKYGGFGGI